MILKGVIMDITGMFQIFDIEIERFIYEMNFSINVFELIFLVFFIFEIGFIVGKQDQFKHIVRFMMINRFLSLPSLIESDIKKQQSISHDSTVSECLTMAADKQKFDLENIETLFFQEKIPFQAPKRNTKANFQVILQKKGSSLFKVQKYQQISQFESSSSVANYEFNKLKQTIKRISQTDLNEQKNGIQLKLSRSQNSQNNNVLFKRISFREHDNSKISIDGLCENEKLKTLFYQIKKIGEGGFGSVFQATHKAQKKQYAIKKIFLKDLEAKDLIREVTIVNHLTHANIVRYYTWWIEQITGEEKKQIEVQQNIISPRVPLKRMLSINSIDISSSSSNSIIFQDKENNYFEPTNQKIHRQTSLKIKQPQKLYSLFIQMQLYKNGTLQQFLKNKQRKINRGTCFSIIKQLFNGLQFLHSHGVIHRDLKPANIFLDNKQKLIKIGDFGLSVFVDKQMSLGEYKLNDKLGTPCYMAPQIKQNSIIPKPELLDIYSLGVIYFQLLKSFNSSHQRITELKEIQKGKINLSSQYYLQKQLIRFMTRNHKSRLTISELKQTKQFKDLLLLNQKSNWFDQYY